MASTSDRHVDNQELEQPEPLMSEDVMMPPADSVHPAFANLYGSPDVTLVTHDNVLFPISSSTLTRTSGWFRTMFTLPQGSQRAPGGSERIQVGESSAVISGLLSLAAGIGMPAIEEIDLLDDLLRAADKYEMPMPSAVVRAILPLFLAKYSIRVYAIACRMSWEDEASKAATQTLQIDIMSEENRKELEAIDTPHHLLKLLSLHETRRRQMQAALSDDAIFIANLQGGRCKEFGTVNPMDGLVDSECTALVDRSTWVALRLACALEPWRFCALCEGDAPLSRMPELEAVFEDRCRGCRNLYYSQSGTLEKLKNLAESLPQTISWP
ncbi:hypothetical protein C8Q80DRAFT_1265051 [Daedaleopsis nitida]|nr:hypothetical protein C8Q80DRAFT_1265051 [Daedaleopsis nitida]